MRAHGKGSEGSEKGGGGRKEKGGARSTGTPPVYATGNCDHATILAERK